MSLVQFDHAVVVVGDELRARAFYQDFCGAQVEKEFARKGGSIPGGDPKRDMRRSFLSLNDRGHVLGLFEENFAIPVPQEDRSFQTIVMRVEPATYDRVKKELPGVEIEENIPGFERTIYTYDTEGNSIGFTPGPAGSQAMLLRLEIDAPDLAAAVKFYHGVFELDLAETGILGGDNKLPYAWLTVGNEGQGVLIVERSEAPGTYLGHHYAFLVNRADHLEMKANLANLGVEEYRERGRPDARPEGEVGTYLLDPCGRMLQWITHSTSD